MGVSTIERHASLKHFVCQLLLSTQISRFIANIYGIALAERQIISDNEATLTPVATKQ
jgi:hypothetical protein